MTPAYVNSGRQVYDPNAIQMYPNGQMTMMPSPAIPARPAMPYPQQQASYYRMPYSPVYGNQKPSVTNGAPSLSAVKIDINGASMQAGGAGQAGVGAAAASPIYPGMPQLMPPVPQYMPQYPPQGMPMPQPMPYAYPAPPMIPPQQMAGAMPPPPMIPPQQMIGMIPPPQMIVPPMAPQPQQTVNMPVMPPPPAINQQQPQAINQQPQAVPNNIQTAPPPTTAPIDAAVKPLVAALYIINPQPGQNPTPDEQATAIQTIAQYTKSYQAADDMLKADPSNPQATQAKEKADQLLNPILLNENTFKGLAAIAESNTSSLSGKEKEKADENRVMSMWTLAMLQKVFRQELDTEAKKANMPPASMDGLPAINNLVKLVESDPNPDIRQAGIVALMEVVDPKNPKDVKIMTSLMQTASKNDGDDKVKKLAGNVLAEFTKA